jgi:tetratricopeptide (TPR) repeat protein
MVPTRVQQQLQAAQKKLAQLEQLRALYLGCRMKVIKTESFGLGVDEPGDVPKAEKSLKAAVEVNPQDALAHYGLGQCARLLGRHERRRGNSH